MNDLSKTFGVYCSDGASRVIKFYSYRENLIKFRPKKVIYDGDREDVLQKLIRLFGRGLAVFDNRSLSQEEKKRINSLTSSFIHSTLKRNNIEYLLCFGKRILKKEIILEYEKKLINFHPSILPSFRGLKAIDQTLEFGTSFLGNTAHFIDEGIDSGKIILQSAMLRNEYEHYEDVLELQFPMIKMILRDLLNYRISDPEIFFEVFDRKKRYFMPNKCEMV